MRICVDAGMSNEEILKEIKNTKEIIEIFDTCNVKKEIYVPGKIYNLVIEK